MKKAPETIKFIFPPQKILCAVDGLESNKSAIVLANHLGKKLRCEVIFLQVDTSFLYQAELMETSGALSVPVVSPERQLAFLEDRKKELEKHLSEILDDHEKTRVKMVSGDPAISISTELKEGNYDLLIVGRKHKSRMESFFLGSTANNVLEDALVSVLIVPEEINMVTQIKNHGRPFTEVVLATDLQTSDFNTAKVASHLCRAFSIKTTLLHAFESQEYRPIPRDYFTNPDIYSEISEIFQNAHEIKRVSLEKEAENFSERFEFSCSPKLLEGPVRSSLLNYTKESSRKNEIPLLIVGRFTNRSSFGTWLLGSTARTLAMNAECPILVVPHSENKN